MHASARAGRFEPEEVHMCIQKGSKSGFLLFVSLF